jgi:hypothetical protein
LVFAQEWVAPLFAVVLFLGAAFGPSYGPVLRFYRDVIKPRLAPPAELEDPRPPRFAAGVGVVFLSGATIAFLLGAGIVGWGLVVVVGALAGLSAITGLCVGCELYVGLVRIRGGVRVTKVDRIADGRRRTEPSHEGGRTRATSRHDGLAPLPDQWGDDRPDWLVFSTEYCAVCPSVVAEIERVRPGERVAVLDVAEHLDLAARYRVRRAPTVLRTDAAGAVVARLAGVEAVRRELASMATV